MKDKIIEAIEIMSDGRYDTLETRKWVEINCILLKKIKGFFFHHYFQLGEKQFMTVFSFIEFFGIQTGQVCLLYSFLFSKDEMLEFRAKYKQEIDETAQSHFTAWLEREIIPLEDSEYSQLYKNRKNNVGYT